MKHILNNLSEEEKNAIREQHAGGMKIELGKFKQLVEKKLGDVNPLVNEQLIKKTDPKIDADSNKYWQQLKSKLSSLGFKLTFSRMDSEASPNPLKLVYDEQGKREIMTLKKNGFTVNVQWPGGAIDAGVIEPKDCKIDIATDNYNPNFPKVVEQFLALVKQGPGLGKSDYEGGILSQQVEQDGPQFFSVGVNFQPENIANMIKQLIPLLK